MPQNVSWERVSNKLPPMTYDLIEALETEKRRFGGPQGSEALLRVLGRKATSVGKDNPCFESGVSSMTSFQGTRMPSLR